MNTSSVIRSLKWSSLGIIIGLMILYFFLPFGLPVLGVLAVFYLVKGSNDFRKKQRFNATVNLMTSALLAGSALYFWQYHPNMNIFWTAGTLAGLLIVLIFSLLWRARR